MARSARSVDTAAIAATEQWFIERGLPHFIDGYSASRDVLTRAIPLLTAVYVAEVAINAPSGDYSVLESLGAVLAGLAILLAAWMVANGLRGRPLRARPDRVGPLEVVVFVIAPPVVPLIFGFQWRSAVVTAAVNVGLLAAIYVVTSYGIVPMTRWAAGRTLRQASTVIGLYVRALPLLLLFVAFLFLTNEVWQVNGSLVGPFYWIVLAFFPFVGTVFAAMRLPREIGRLGEHESWRAACEQARGTPGEALVSAAKVPPPDEARRLTRRQWGNIGLVVLFSQGVQVLLVMTMIFAVLVSFGLMVATEPIVAGFLGHQPHVLATLDLWGRSMALTEELLRVAGFLAVFSGFYFTVAVLTDQTYREEFLDDVVTEVGRALAVRTVYVAVIRGARPS